MTLSPVSPLLHPMKIHRVILPSALRFTLCAIIFPHHPLTAISESLVKIEQRCL